MNEDELRELKEKIYELAGDFKTLRLKVGLREDGSRDGNGIAGDVDRLKDWRDGFNLQKLLPKISVVVTAIGAIWLFVAKILGRI